MQADHWSLARLSGEIEKRDGVSLSRSQLSKILRKKTSVGNGRGTA